MKKLWVIRHAKSDWNVSSQSDFERPLNKRGILSANFMGEFLRNNTVTPELILCSPAKRTSTTAKLLLEKIGGNNEITFIESMYASHYSNLVDIVQNTDKKIKNIMLIGHNPGVSNLITYFTGEDRFMKTCTVAEIRFDLDEWQFCIQNTGLLADFNYPKAFPEFQKKLNES